jgi:transcriptional regulator with XRE-family HTH domain
MDPWHIGPRLRYWRKRRGLSLAALADLVGRSSSWVQMAETGHRAPYNILDLVNLAIALRVDLAAFLCDPVPGVPDGDQQQLLLALRDAFQGSDPREGMARLAWHFNEADAGDDLMLVVLPGGSLQVVNRREAVKLGAVVGVSLAGSALNPDHASQLLAALDSREVSRDGVTALGALVAAYRRLDDEIGSATLRPLVQHNLNVVKGLRATSDTVGRQLGMAAAEFYRLAGWLAFDAGDYEAARKHYGAALRVADQLDETMVAARMLTEISYLETTAQRLSEGIRAATSGMARAAQTPSRTLRAYAAVFQARAQAEAGEADAARAAIDLAERELHAARPEDDPPFMYYVDQAVLDRHAGWAYVALGEPRRANDILGSAAAGYGPPFVRGKAGCLVYRAYALTLANEIPEACRVGLEAAGLLDRASSARTVKLLKELHAVQLRPYWALPEVRELGDRLYAL